MATVRFPREQMMLVLGEDEGRIISDEIIDHTRWSVVHDLVFELNGQLYSTSYSTGATESQDERPWEDLKSVKCIEVRPVEKTIVVYEPI